MEDNILWIFTITVETNHKKHLNIDAESVACIVGRIRRVTREALITLSVLWGVSRSQEKAYPFLGDLSLLGRQPVFL